MNFRPSSQALFLLLFAAVVMRSEQCLRNNNMAQEALIRRWLKFFIDIFSWQSSERNSGLEYVSIQSASSNQQQQVQNPQQQGPSQQQPIDQTQINSIDQAENQRLPLPECYVGASNMVCCNRQLEQSLIALASDSFKRFTRQTFIASNNTALENFSANLQSRVQSRYNESFEVIVSTGNFASRIHFYGNYFCKVSVDEGYYILVYATPKPELEPYATAGPVQENGYLSSLHRTWTMAEPTYPAATQPPPAVAVIHEDQLWPWPHNAPPAMTTPSIPEGIATLAPASPRKRNITMSHHRIWYQRIWNDLL
ncbi:ground-like domain-containing protein [Ditylenchus destructor]|uniref:Ground-like domain-containing protein n=1 Tax=Ditylenchus destructor TaxID=166010 RepID=A0AAD4QYG1_9BILA|nr:ground-like domain-containing protein [Ditylenchus destructor]